MTVATDGETFGHHHRFGEMALGRALQILAADATVGVGGIGAFIAAHPPEYEAELFVPSAWSCGHGVERWRSDCGDSTGGGHGWNQSWRAPLRQALDWLRDRLAAVFETEAGRLLRDPWEARDEYAEVFAVGADARVAFVQERAAASLSPADVRRCLVLLEMQRHVLLAFSSCGWFFSDCAGLETVEILRQAGYALELAARTSGEQLEPEFVHRLATMRSNEDAEGDGGTIWERHVRPALVGPDRLAAWWFGYATAAAPPERVGDYELDGELAVTRAYGAALATGHVEVRNLRTLDVTRWAGSALAGPDGRFVCGVEPEGDDHSAGAAGCGDVVAALHSSGAQGGGDAIRERYGAACFGLEGVPLEVRTVIVEARVVDGLAAQPPLEVTDLRGLDAAVRAAQLGSGSGPWHDLVVRTTEGVATRVALAPNGALTDVGALTDLAWLLTLVDGRLPDGARWRVQNAVLFARDRVLPDMRKKAEHGDGGAQLWVRALSAAERLAGVSPVPTGLDAVRG